MNDRVKKPKNRKKSCFSCFHGRRIDSLNTFAICLYGCKSEKDYPELIVEPNSGDCSVYKNREDEIGEWLEDYMGDNKVESCSA